MKARGRRCHAYSDSLVSQRPPSCPAISHGRCYGAAARILHSIVADVNRWSAPMQKLKSLSRSLAPLEPDGTLMAFIERSLSSWLVAGIVPGVERQPLKKLAIDESA